MACVASSLLLSGGPSWGPICLFDEQLCELQALHSSGLHLPVAAASGAVVGIIGGNGAGKSTLFRMVMGQETPDAGQVQLGETVVPMYVDQSRDALQADKTVRCRCI